MSEDLDISQTLDQKGLLCPLPIINTAKEISASLSIPVIICGGAGNFKHLVDVFKNTGVSAAACSSLFHFGDNNPIRARSYLRNHGIPMRVTK